ncbi:ATP-binding protein [Patescibacteria group bacterium]|nr:MAG: ATP-binding protein [Patescibacteria group bacterium]
MYTRLLNPPKEHSFFLFGPRGVGKTTWLKAKYPSAIYLDLLEFELYQSLLANPQRLEAYTPRDKKNCVIIDEVQRVPALLHEVHRLIESKKIQFILTGSSARGLKRNHADLLAGRALTYKMFPLTAVELQKDFDIGRALRYGQMPKVYNENDPSNYLSSYIATYLKEEVQQEGLTRNLGAFSRFLETASFSQGQVLNISDVARECSANRKTVEGYFTILEDLLLAHRVPVFTKKAKRRVVAHPKFYFFDVGVYRGIRPSGPLDAPEEIDGSALETLIFQEIMAVNAYFNLGYKLFYWRTADQAEVDFVLYGKRGIVAIEVKRTKNIQSKHLRSLSLFLADYPMAKTLMLYGSDRLMHDGKNTIVPINSFLTKMTEYI